MTHYRYGHVWLVFAAAAYILASPITARGAPDARTASEEAQGEIVVEGLAGPPVKVVAHDVTQLPPVSVTVSFDTEHSSRKASFEGPLLWTVLVHAGAIDPAKPRDQVREIITVTGRDGYTAVLALGEIAPEFEAKQVIVADRTDGQKLDVAHLRIIVPNDRRGGRSVRDVNRIRVIMPPLPPQ